MKKTMLSIAIFSSIAINATSFNVVVDKERNKFDTSGFTDETTISPWSDSKPVECYFDLELDDFYYGIDFNQTETCDQEQERTITVERTYADGSKDIVSETKEYQTITTSETNLVTGTHLEESCNKINIFDSSITTGMQRLRLQSGTEVNAYCDMNNGGWTRLDKGILADSSFVKTTYITAGKLEVYNSGYRAGHDAGSSNKVANNILEIELGFDYQQFRLKDYKSKDISNGSDTFDMMTYNSTNSNWGASHSSSNTAGDVAFGTRDNAKPTTSFVDEGANRSVADALYSFPRTDATYDNGVISSTFSIKTTESGTQHEYIELWNSGYIYFK